MNKQQRQELEDMVRQLAEEPYNPSEAHIEEIKRQAFEEYDQIMAAKQKMKEKRKGTLRRVVVTAAAIICLLIGSTVIALLNPLQSGNADNFFRRAVIWVNDQLHLGIELPVQEKEKSSSEFHASQQINSLREIASSLNTSIVCFGDNDDLCLEFINEDTFSPLPESIVTLRYSTSDGIINIENQIGTYFNMVNIHSDFVSEINTPVGNLTVWETENITRGVLLLDNNFVSISAYMPLSIFSGYCTLFEIFN